MDDDVVSLSDHLAVFRRRWRLIVILTVLGALAGVGISALQTRMYDAESRLLVEPLTTTSSAVVMDPDEVATQASVVTSEEVASMVIDDLGLSDSPQDLLDSVTVTVVDNTRVLSIVASRAKPQEAADIANAFADQYVTFRADAAAATAGTQKSGYIAQLTKVRSTLSDVRAQLKTATNEETKASLAAREQSLVAQEAELSTQLMLIEDGDVGPGGEVLLDAQVPTSPSRPKPILAALLGALLGLIAGILGAYLRDRLDDRVTTEERLKDSLGQAPVLGRIPDEDRKRRDRLISLTEPRSSVSDAYRALATNVRFLTAVHSRETDQGELLLVTSAVSGEGKTTVAANLAVTAARMGIRVFLVDADLRAPSLADRLGVDPAIGLAHLLTGEHGLPEALVDIGVENLRVLCAGAVPPNPAELLASERAPWMWDRLRASADLVIVDSAPVLQVPDALEIARLADLIVISATHSSSRRHNLRVMAERLRQVGGRVSGSVLTRIPGKPTAYGPEYQAARG